MPDWLQWIVYIAIVIVMIGVLVAVHEAGHLAMAKLFKVYCFEYSIGMGPKIFSKKRKKGETTFSIRAIPFGGYVSMYGETEEVPEGVEKPDPSRSLNAIAKWKKCLVLVAGVTLNFALGLVLIYIGDQFCPIYYANYLSRAGSYSYLDTTYADNVLSYIENHKAVPSGEEGAKGYSAADYKVSFGIYETAVPDVYDMTQQVGILATHVRLYESAEATVASEIEYVAVYIPSSVTTRNSMASCISFYPVDSSATIPDRLKDLGIDQVPQLYINGSEDNAFNVSGAKDGTHFSVPFRLAPLATAAKDESYEQGVQRYRDTVLICDDASLFRFDVSNHKLTGPEMNVEVIEAWLSFPDAWKQWSKDVPNACSAVFKGFVTLFMPNGWKNVSGIIGITTAMPQITSAGGARMVFYFAGVISINLCFFNLLPFPGLDGWQLLVTVIEGVSKKKVPAKVQTIVSYVGIALLFALMIAIAVKDIIAMF